MEAHPITARDLIGAWGLVSFEIEEDGRTVLAPFGDDPQGALIYTEEGRFSAQVMRAGRRPMAGGDVLSCAPDEAMEAVRGCVSYFGAYDVDDDRGFVTHRVDGSLFPNWESDVQTRYAALDGHVLRLRTPEMLIDGRRRSAVLEWRRM